MNYAEPANRFNDCASSLSAVPYLHGAKAQSQRQLSLKEQAGANGGKVTVSTNVDVPRVTLEELTKLADLVVRGVVTGTRTQLSPSEERIRTYVTLSPGRLFKDTNRKFVRPMPQPGPSPSVVFYEVGGVLHQDGLEMHDESKLLSNPPLRTGEELVAVLVKTDEPGVYRLSHGAYGLLRIAGGKAMRANKYVARKRPLNTGDVVMVQSRIENAVKSAKSGR